MVRERFMIRNAGCHAFNESKKPDNKKDNSLNLKNGHGNLMSTLENFDAHTPNDAAVPGS